MLKKIHKIPAGILLVPMVVSAVLYTLCPGLVRIGGLTESLLSGKNVSFIVACLCLCSGTAIDLNRLKRLIKHHGVLVLVKFCLSLGLGIFLIKYLPVQGVLGVSTVAMVVIIASINPSVYLSIMTDYGTEDDQAAQALLGIFGTPIVPVLAYSLASGQGGLDWMPILSTLFPLLLGMVLGNIDPDFVKLFGPGVALFLPLLGWNLGQGINLVSAFSVGLSGLFLLLIFYLSAGLLVIFECLVFKNKGKNAVAMMAAAGVGASTPLVISFIDPSVMPYTGDASAQILMVVLLSSILTPILVSRIYSPN